MKFKNNTRWNTKQLRKIVAEVMNRYLSSQQRKNLTVIMRPIRTGGRFKVAQALDDRIACIIPNDATPAAIRFNIGAWARNHAQTKNKETQSQHRTWYERVDQLPLEEAAPTVKKKKDVLEEAEAALKNAERGSARHKSKLIRAANKIQEYDRQAKYYEARIVLIQKERRGVIRKKKTPKKGDNEFRIRRPKRGN